jgi:hypothetical protein
MSITALSTIQWTALATVLALSHGAGAGTVPLQNPRDAHRPIPLAMLLEHAELDASLKAAAREDGDLGAAARAVLELVEPHMKREQALALPPLRLLPRLANREFGGDIAEMVAVTARLRAELPTLRSEHVAIKRALEELWATAWAVGKPEYAFLAQRVNRHIEIDEQVVFPMSLVVGDYLALLRARTPPTD